MGLLRDDIKRNPGYSTLVLFRDKVKMKAALKAKDLDNLPKFIFFNPENYQNQKRNYLEEIVKYLGLPIFAKKIDGAGSVDTTKINSELDLEQWATSHPGVPNYELDEYVDGPVYHCDSLVVNRKVLFSTVANTICPPALYHQGFPAGTMIVPDDLELTLAIKRFNETVLGKMEEHPDGIYHLE